MLKVTLHNNYIKLHSLCINLAKILLKFLSLKCRIGFWHGERCGFASYEINDSNGIL